ncbi:alcohol dehydrogenase catalytic domain-containing protein [Mesorhizobium sp. B2-4-15]|uniref:alcohol dehydrogenase catalytic domain-containing protein n=1 Tax=Mesorhizobium sp. B2-4-15 TaxID=2589934 RepID=UPI001FEE4195|nr:alcohol dehydrogenase catalytic domain-containing protein [Mesorhizobium sp. B2-4-15]
MKLGRLRAPDGLDRLELVEEDPPQPGPGDVLVRIRACSLNMRDDFAVRGKTPLADSRVPLSDGAGEVVAVGDDVDAFRPGDSVVSTFYPWWLDGVMTPATKAPAGYTHAEAATLTCTGVTAWRGLVASRYV